MPTGATTEEQSDGSTLFTDYDNNYQFTIPEAWLVIPLSSDDLSDILQGLSEENPQLKEIAATFAQLDPDVIRVMAMNKDMKYSVNGFSTNLTVTAIEDKLMSAMPMDFVTGAVEDSLKQGGATIIPNEALAADNANGVEVGVLEFQKTTPTATGASMEAHSKILIFNAGAKMVMIQLSAPKQFARRAYAHTRSDPGYHQALRRVISRQNKTNPSRRIIAGRDFSFQQGDRIMSGPRTVRAPRGTDLTCKNWLSEAAYRMIQNNLDPEVAEKPEDLVVYGGRGKAARAWEAFDAILESLKNLEEDETLLVQSGKPVVVFKSHKDAPKVLIANSNLVPHWATWEHFDELAKKGLIMYGQMTAGSWIYIGTQGILQGTYETFGALAKLKGWGSLKGKFVLTAGLGGMGGAQPLSITMNEGVGLIVEVDPERAERRRAIGYVDTVVDTLEEAMTLVEEAKEQQIAKVHWVDRQRGGCVHGTLSRAE